MAIEKIADYLYISNQLDERFAKRAAQYGIQTVICNRPDDEEPNQPSFEQVKTWLNAVGIENVVYMPVVMDGIDDAALREFQETVAKSPAPILAYCRTGTRSAMMWALNQTKRGVEVNSLIKAAELANIDLEPHRYRLEIAYKKRG
ncbi:TIGR01244 family sulfur transferase [Wielerella bovis]|uniref:TIGR01244 family sulfur transferase n=1 Tax=Wielerella bovis TaxID=2917790 RepID=UPI002019ABAF|nr:TIGR01244 family sulfur transferase [Wielerella bovis]ULJ61174.1 TIGR01244 family sulfur transferase [Wielerella bovis]ULJ68849.1 TIGR01244 family sulfur transferase [Wielerella bovis]